MSRLIVKNLPRSITEKELRKTFGGLGELTDCQLKYTQAGAFRKFAFVGYQTEKEAKEAAKYLNQTFIGTSRIVVEECLPLGDKNKPRAWSKYSQDSSAYQRLNNPDDSQPAQTVIESDKKSKKKKKKKKKGEKNEEEDVPVESQPGFKDFLEVQGVEVPEDVPVKGGNLEAASDDVQDGGIDPKLLEELMDGVRTEGEVGVIISGLPTKVKLTSLKEFIAPVRLKFGKISRSEDPPCALALLTLNRASDQRRVLQKTDSFFGGFKLTITKANMAQAAVKSANPDLRPIPEEDTTAKEIQLVSETGRIFVKNLSFFCTENDLKSKFEEYGTVTDVTIVIDKKTQKSKGYGLVTFMFPEHGVKAFTELDGTVFQGRMLHLIGGKEKPGSEAKESEPTESSFKTKKKEKEKVTAQKAHTWNALFIGADAVADVISTQLDTDKSNVLDAQSKSSLGVRMALGEAQIVRETRLFLERNGVALDSFGKAAGARSDTVILAKNLPAKTEIEELQTTFGKFGDLGRAILPPSGISGLIEFVQPHAAKAAFKALAYSRFRTKPLFLEWAPVEVFSGPIPTEEEAIEEGPSETVDMKPELGATIFVKNVNFETEDQDFENKFRKIGPPVSASISKRLDSRTKKFLSMGYGFVQYYLESDAKTALKELQGSLLDGHALELKLSHRETETLPGDVRKTVDKTEQGDCSKILVRNIPFQANKNEITEIFSTFGQLRFVRLPSQVDKSNHRGFAFVDFITKADAGRAFKALSHSTHLYGRRLVLEWAKAEESLEDVRKRTADHFVTGENRAKQGKHKRELMKALTGDE